MSLVLTTISHESPSLEPSGMPVPLDSNLPRCYFQTLLSQNTAVSLICINLAESCEIESTN